MYGSSRDSSKSWKMWAEVGSFHNGGDPGDTTNPVVPVRAEAKVGLNSNFEKLGMVPLGEVMSEHSVCNSL